jgi:GntR family transcriptional regulator/MocR family aminotransferase
MLNSLGERLKIAYPQAVECRTGRTDPGLFPFTAIQRAWRTVTRDLTAQDLQYSGPEPIPGLVRELVPLLRSDEVPARPEDLLVGSSSQQFLSLVSEVLVRQYGAGNVLIAVEEPGYPTAMDTFERAGITLVGVAVDRQGVTPDGLEAALSAGAKAVLFTPRAHNPTGAAWSPGRRASLAEVLSANAGVIIIEDDQLAGIASTCSGSLLADARLEDRVVYVRSFSKSIGPDLRVAVAAARPVLKRAITEAKVFADGWTSRLLQKTLAAILADPELPRLLARARQAYRERREMAAETLNGLLSGHGAGTWSGPDGLSLWVHLPTGIEPSEVAERAAMAGVRIDPGDPFFVQPGHSDFVRLNAGLVPTKEAGVVGKLVAEAILACSPRDSAPSHV